MKKIILISFALVITCWACQHKDSKSDAAAILTRLNHGNSLDNIDRVLVIPGEGCPGCISDAGDFAQSNIDSLPRMMVVFTRVLDKKLLRVKFNREFLTHERVLIDSSNLLDRSDLLGSYPVVFYFHKGEYKRTESFDKGMFVTK